MDMDTTYTRINRFVQCLAEYEDGEGLDTNIVDILADVQHYCKQQDIDFSSCLSTAVGHFEAETQEDITPC